MYRWHVVSAIFWRNFKQYFTSVLGYLFIFVFVTVCAVLTFNQQFFADNLVTLDQLSRYFPALLLFFIPAITMSVWADEKKQGTDAILFTLPASDFEILMGKFQAVVAVYSVALLFSGTTLIALARLGSPDWGMVAATYFGYWLAGVALASIGMFASSLTNSTTVAFVTGSILCAIPVLFGYLMEGNRFFESYGVAGQLRDFSLGLVSMPGVVYFLTITAFMLYLNHVVISRRHWSRGQQVTLSSHFALRVVALSLALFSVNVLAEKSSVAFRNRVDLTAESLFTLDDLTRKTIEDAAKNKRPVTIQAFLSPNMPRRYVNTRKNLVGLLHQYDRLGGTRIDVRFVNVEPNSKEVDEALSLGIEKRPTRDTVAGRVVEQDVYMGVVVTSTFDEVVLPFIAGDSSIEYQLTRSIATATAEQQRLKIGILKTDAHFDNLQYEGEEIDWVAPTTLEALRNQYDVVSISPDSLPELTEPALGSPDDDSVADKNQKEIPDVLVVADPSSLTMVGMFNLMTYIQAGHPTLILADPLPFYPWTYRGPEFWGLINAPAQPRISPRGQWQPVATSTEPKAANGTANPLMQMLGVDWRHDSVVWSVLDPHVGFKPNLADGSERWNDAYGPKQNVFVFAKSHGTHNSFSDDDPVSSGLHELMFVYPGSLKPAKDAETTFEPLVMLKAGSAGHLDWNEITEDFSITRLELNPMTGSAQRVTRPLPSRHTGHIVRTIRKRPKLDRPDLNSESADEKESSDAGENPETNASGDQNRRRIIDDEAHVLAARIKSDKADRKINVIFIADIDFISDMYFIQKDALETSLDNYTFFVNALESLAGDETFVRLRNRRPTPRTLTTIERLKEPFKLDAVKKRDEAEAESAARLNAGKQRTAEEEQKLNRDDEMSEFERASRLAFNDMNDQRRATLQEDRIQRDLEKSISNIRGEEQRNTRNVESRLRWLSILSAGIPALFLGSIVLLYRTLREQRQIDPQRRVQSTAKVN